jgi:hypothetical protein
VTGTILINILDTKTSPAIYRGLSMTNLRDTQSQCEILPYAKLKEDLKTE